MTFHNDGARPQRAFMVKKVGTSEEQGLIDKAPSLGNDVCCVITAGAGSPL